MNHLAPVSLDELVARCAHETDQFTHHRPSDPRYAFELLRRALADDCAEAFTHVYQLYQRMTWRW